MPDSPTGLTCRFCRAPVSRSFADLGVVPLANVFLTGDDLLRSESFYPLHARVCETCFLVQIPEVVNPQTLFRRYTYFSSYSDTWLDHCRRFAESASERFGLGPESSVIEVGSNDGHLLRLFCERGMRVLGVEPAENVAAEAVEAGIPTRQEYFSLGVARRMAEEGERADLLIGNNVLAHVPDLNGFVSGLKAVLAPGGAASLEFPHLERLIEQHEFDTVYHEHYSYFSLSTVRRVFAAAGLTVFDVEEIPTHGGSLRVLARHEEEGSPPVAGRVAELEDEERRAGMTTPERYDSFAEDVRAVKRELLSFLIDVKRRGKAVAGYGAPAKGNILLNFCGIGRDFLDYTVDRSPHKQGRFLPGLHVPIHPPERIAETRPDYLLILPWNLKEEIMEQMSSIREWGGRFVTPIPRVEVHP